MHKDSKKKYRAVERKITRLLETLPPDVLVALIKTKDQIDYWTVLRHHYADVAKCWEALHSGRNDPLAPLLKSGEISKNTYDHLWLTVDFYERLWELIQISFCFVKPELERLGLEYVPESACELFSLFLFDAASSEFTLCLSYVELSARKPGEEYQLASKLRRGQALLPHEIVRLNSLSEKQHPIMMILFATCHKKASRRQPVLKARLEAAYTALFNLSNKQLALRRKGGSFAWKDGELFEGSRYGGCYAKKPETDPFN